MVMTRLAATVAALMLGGSALSLDLAAGTERGSASRSAAPTIARASIGETRPDALRTPRSGSPGEEPVPFDLWLEDVREEALARGISPETVRAALGGIAPVPQILERDRAQAEFRETLQQYIDRRVGPVTIRTARARAATHARLLERVEATYGVPGRFVVAIWGLESNFGRFSGVRPIFPTLATLAYDPRRPTLFRGELFHALAIVDQGLMDVAGMKGSWAGAMGQPQFLPSSFLQYAVDFDGDGRRDIWTSTPDVFGSVAHYLQGHGWTPGQTWGRVVRLPDDTRALDTAAPLRTEGCRASRELTEPLPLQRWQDLGVRTATGGPLPDVAMDASLLRTESTAYLVYGNYEALLRYNCATAYALAVARLADRIADTDPLPAPRPPAKRTPAKKAPAKKR
jgi:membrane-bound lytic murein transglycosylase B